VIRRLIHLCAPTDRATVAGADPLP
jgi:hypothetical protein